MICDDLRTWRDNEFLDKFYPGTSIVSSATLIGDDVVEKLAKCGERLETGEELGRHIRWPIRIDAETGILTPYSEDLLQKLQTIYKKIDNEASTNRTEQHTLPSKIDMASFYQGSSTQIWIATNTMQSHFTEDMNETSTNPTMQHGRGRGRGAMDRGGRTVTGRHRGRLPGRCRGA